MTKLWLVFSALICIIIVPRWLSSGSREVDQPAKGQLQPRVVQPSPGPPLNEIDVPRFPYGEAELLKTAVTRISEDEFRVVLSKDIGWFDTGIPVIANELITVRDTQEEIIVSVGPRVDRLRAADGLFYSEKPDNGRLGVDPGLQEVLAISLPDDSAAQIVTLVVQVSVRQCDLDLPSHQQLHSQAHSWFDQKFAIMPIRAQ